jgi:hypothetical protein
LESFVGGGVFDVVACVVGEDGGVAGGEVEGAGCGLVLLLDGLRVEVLGQRRRTLPTKAVARAVPERK